MQDKEIMQDIAVMKFGGSSVKSIARIQHVADLIMNFPAMKKVVIVSAMGDSTDHLIKLAKQCTVQPDERELDLLLATGEQVSSALLAMTLASAGIQAKSYTGTQLGILTDSCHSSARIIDINRERLKKAIADNEVIVITGFQGLSQQGDVTTLGRGGSDTSAVAIAAALNADFCHIFTDVDGVFSADPGVVKDARFLPVISYQESLELARAGAQVIHPRAVQLAEDYAIKLQVRNTFKPELEGTLIQGENLMERKQCISGVAIESHVACLEIRGALDAASPMAELPDSQRILADGLNICQDTAGKISTILITFKYSDADEFEGWIDSLKEKHADWQITKDRHLAKVSLIGRGLTNAPSCLPRFLSALQNKAIEIRHLACSESCISAVVSADRAEDTAQVIHAEFVGEPEPSTQTQQWTQVVA